MGFGCRDDRRGGRVRSVAAAGFSLRLIFRDPEEEKLEPLQNTPEGHKTLEEIFIAAAKLQGVDYIRKLRKRRRAMGLVKMHVNILKGKKGKEDGIAEALLS